MKNIMMITLLITGILAAETVSKFKDFTLAENDTLKGGCESI